MPGPLCAWCESPAKDEKLLRCSGCKQRLFHPSCQREAWVGTAARPGHKKECKNLKAWADAMKKNKDKDTD